MRNAFIALLTGVALTGCIWDQQSVTPEQSVHAQEIRSELEPCVDHFPSCSGYILEYEDGQLVKLEVVSSAGSMNWSTLSNELLFDSHISRIVRVYTPEDSEFHRAVYQHACMYNEACAPIMRQH